MISAHCGALALGTRSARWSAIFQDFALGVFSFRCRGDWVHLLYSAWTKNIKRFPWLRPPSFHPLFHSIFLFFPCTCFHIPLISSSFSSSTCLRSLPYLAGTTFLFCCFPKLTFSDLCPLSASIPDNSLSVELEDCSRREQKRDYTARLVDRSSNT